MSEGVCKYCWEQPIDTQYGYTCEDCVFTCGFCKQVTPYERGVSWDTLCDDCGVAVQLIS
jgi:hypothetical protein